MIRKIVIKNDLSICSIASFTFKCRLTVEREVKKHINIFKKCVELAKDLDSKIIRTFTFWKQGDLANYLELILEQYRYLIDLADDEDVIIAVENEPSTFVRSGRDLSVFLNRVKSRKVYALWDPGNTVWLGSGIHPYPNEYSHIRGKIIHVHVKDVAWVRGKPTPVKLGEGIINYVDQFKALYLDGYRGYISLETHWKPDKRMGEEELLMPGGVKYSKGMMKASELCMRKLIELINNSLPNSGGA